MSGEIVMQQVRLALAAVTDVEQERTHGATANLNYITQRLRDARIALLNATDPPLPNPDPED